MDFFSDLTTTECIQVFVFIAGLILFIILGIMNLKKKQLNKRFLKQVDDIYEGYGFKSLKRKEFETHIRTLSKGKFFLGNHISAIDLNRCYKKSSGAVDFYLSDVQGINICRRTGRSSIVPNDEYWNFYCAIRTPIMDELILYHKERAGPNDFFGKKINVTNSVDDFDSVFIVKSTDFKLTEAAIPAEIQKILLAYNEKYPIRSMEMQKIRTYVLINKKEISISAPYTQDSHSVISLFEMGVEIVQYLKEERS